MGVADVVHELYGKMNSSITAGKAMQFLSSVLDYTVYLVWMRPGAARTVRKLYGRINSDIPAGKAKHILSCQCFVSA